MKVTCFFDPLRDVQMVEEIPEFECNIERMLATGSIGEIANNAEDYNNLAIDQIGHRIEDVFDAANHLNDFAQMSSSKAEINE